MRNQKHEGAVEVSGQEFRVRPVCKVAWFSFTIFLHHTQLCKCRYRVGRVGGTVVGVLPREYQGTQAG